MNDVAIYSLKICTVAYIFQTSSITCRRVIFFFIIVISSRIMNTKG